MTAALTFIAMVATSAPNLQLILDDLRATQQVPGISAVVAQKGEVVFAGGSGLADLETNRNMTADTRLYAGSLSKIFTAVVALNLVEHGQLSLDEVVTGIAIDSRRVGGGIRVSHLLTHASGLEREGDFGYWFSADFPDRAALASYLRNTELRETPGTSIHYSNIAYAALGAKIEDVSNENFATTLDRRVLQPLGMTTSGAPGPVADIAIGYTPVNKVIPSATRPFAGVGRRVGDRHVREYHDAKAMTPAFGIYTSANDLSRLAQFLLGVGGKDVLSEKTRGQMLRRQASGWGLGIKIGRWKGRPVARHSGWFAAHRSHLLLDLESGTSVAIIANSDNASTDDVAEALLAAMLGLATEQ